MTGLQLPLELRVPHTARFDNFVCADQGALVTTLQRVLATPQDLSHGGVVYLHGARDSGKTHLLNAACNAVDASGCRAFYLPLADHRDFTPAILEGLNEFDLLCLDDIDAIAGQGEWETALFHCYNALREHHGLLFTSASRPLVTANFTLPDLATRLGWGLNLSIPVPSDATKRQILINRAMARSLLLPESVADYLVQHTARDLRSLLQALDRIDQAGLTEKRRITLPFVKQQLLSPLNFPPPDLEPL